MRPLVTACLLAIHRLNMYGSCIVSINSSLFDSIRRDQCLPLAIHVKDKKGNDNKLPKSPASGTALLLLFSFFTAFCKGNVVLTHPPTNECTPGLYTSCVAISYRTNHHSGWWYRYRMSWLGKMIPMDFHCPERFTSPINEYSDSCVIAVVFFHQNWASHGFIIYAPRRSLFGISLSHIHFFSLNYAIQHHDCSTTQF